MDKAVAELFVSIADDLGIEGVSLYEDYSGRGMYGEKTTGIIIPSLDYLPSLAIELAFRITDRPLDEERERQNIRDLIRGLVSDSMGRNSVIVY